MILKGKSVSEKIVVGEVFIYRPISCECEIRIWEDKDAGNLVKQYQTAKARARAELDALKEWLADQKEDTVEFVQAHQDILSDTMMDEGITDLIVREKLCPDAAVFQMYENYINIFSGNKNLVIRERAADLRDVRARLLRCMQEIPEKNLSHLEKPCIVAAREMLPTDTLSLDRKNTLGIITEKGSLTSHTAIIARSLDIPAILGVPGLLEVIKDNEKVVLDGGAGNVVLHPAIQELEEYTAMAKRIALK